MYTLWKTYDLIYLNGSHRPEKAVKIDAICFDRILMRFFSIFEKFDLTKKQ